MPIYEYQCLSCGHKLEKIQGFNDNPIKKCPKCGQNALEKCISVPNFQLKGSGWYETDFKKKKEDGDSSKPAVKQEEVTQNKPTVKDTSKDSH